MNLHSWEITPKQAVALQRELAPRVRIEPMHKRVRTIAGVDAAYVGSHRSGGRAIAAAVLCNARTMKVIASAVVELPCKFPYVPGLLTFREAPAVIAAVEKLPQRPDLLICDGQGIAHPRRIGLASHVGLWLDLPAIGAAKSRLCGEHRTPGPRRGSRRRLVHKDEVVGACLRTRDRVKPLFVSVGHRITLDQAVTQVLRCCRAARMPEPTRLAHHLVTMRSKTRCP